MSRVRGSLSFANVISAAALFVALSGTAYAAGLKPNSVGTKELEPRAVERQDIAPSAVRGGKVEDGSLALKDFAENQLPTRGAVGPMGPQGERGLQGLDGSDGIDGSNGIDGSDGIDGVGGTCRIDGIERMNSGDADRVLCASSPFTLKARCTAHPDGYMPVTVATLLIDTSIDNTVVDGDPDFDDADAERQLSAWADDGGGAAHSTPLAAASDDVTLAGVVLVGATRTDADTGAGNCAFGGTA